MFNTVSEKDGRAKRIHCDSNEEKLGRDTLDVLREEV
jgi:hypothetical protein